MTEDKLRELFQATNTAEPLSEGWPGLHRFGTAVAEAERERCAELLDDQRYMTLDPLRTYSSDEVWQTIRSSVQHLAKIIRVAND